MTIDKIIEYGAITFLLYHYIKGKIYSTKKSEYEVMQLANATWKEYTENLSNRVNELTNEIASLRTENNSLRLEIQNLDNIIRHLNK